MRLEGGVALIVGVGGEIGSATARRFAQEGALVAVCESRLATAERVSNIIKEEKGKALAFETDVCQRDQVDTMVDQIVEKWGQIDILINDAGMRRDGPFLDMEFDVWKEILETHLDGCFNCTQSVVRHMAERHYGRIINFSAARETEIVARHERANYLSASAGIEGLTYALAKELGKYGITVNCIVPEFIDTEMLRNSARVEGLYLDDLKKLSASLVPLRRLGKAEEVASVCLFLASDEASFVSGQIIGVKGGP